MPERNLEIGFVAMYHNSVCNRGISRVVFGNFQACMINRQMVNSITEFLTIMFLKYLLGIIQVLIIFSQLYFIVSQYRIYFQLILDFILKKSSKIATMLLVQFPTEKQIHYHTHSLIKL